MMAVRPPIQALLVVAGLRHQRDDRASVLRARLTTARCALQGRSELAQTLVGVTFEQLPQRCAVGHGEPQLLTAAVNGAAKHGSQFLLTYLLQPEGQLRNDRCRNRDALDQHLTLATAMPFGQRHVGSAAALIVGERAERLPRDPAKVGGSAVRTEDADAHRLELVEVVLEEGRPSVGVLVALALARMAPQHFVDPQPKVPLFRQRPPFPALFLSNPVVQRAVSERLPTAQGRFRR